MISIYCVLMIFESKFLLTSHKEEPEFLSLTLTPKSAAGLENIK